MKAEVPTGWVRALDGASGRLYFYNLATQESVWKLPGSVSPQTERRHSGRTRDRSTSKSPQQQHVYDAVFPQARGDSGSLYGTVPPQFVVYTRDGEEDVDGEGSPEGARARGTTAERIVDVRQVLPAVALAPHKLPQWLVEFNDSLDSIGSAGYPATPEAALLAFDDLWQDVPDRKPPTLPSPSPHLHPPPPLPRTSPIKSSTSSSSPVRYVSSSSSSNNPLQAEDGTCVPRLVSADGQWEVQMDPASGRPFYFHFPSATSTWLRPGGGGGGGGVEFMTSSSTWRSIAPQSMLPKPPPIVDAARHALTTALGHWPPPPHVPLADVLSQFQIDASCSPLRRKPIGKLSTTDARLPHYVSERVSACLDKRREDVNVLRRSDHLSKLAQEEGMHLRKLPPPPPQSPTSPLAVEM